MEKEKKYVFLKESGFNYAMRKSNGNYNCFAELKLHLTLEAEN